MKPLISVHLKPFKLAGEALPETKGFFVLEKYTMNHQIRETLGSICRYGKYDAIVNSTLFAEYEYMETMGVNWLSGKIEYNKQFINNHYNAGTLEFILLHEFEHIIRGESGRKVANSENIAFDIKINHDLMTWHPDLKFPESKLCNSRLKNHGEVIYLNTLIQHIGLKTKQEIVLNVREIMQNKKMGAVR